MTTIQIYGIKTLEDALAIVAMGAHHIGLEVESDPADQESIRGIIEHLPSSVTAVLLPLFTDPDEIIEVTSILAPDILHLCADVDEYSEKGMQRIRSGLPSIQIMLSVPVGPPGYADRIDSLTIALELQQNADFILLDTKFPDDEAGLPGWIGVTGKVHDWEVSRRIVERCSVPVILAGGLTPDNVAEAIHTVHPWGIDSNTPLNLRKGQKDLGKVQAFIEAIRHA